MEQEYMLKIRSLYNSFSKTEKKVADYIFLNGSKVIYLPITEFGENCGVGETTIIRFCRKIGLKGYQEFKLVLAREMVHPNENFLDNVGNEDSLSEVIRKITFTNIKAIEDTAKMISKKQLDKAVSAILMAEKVDIYGVGASGFTAGDAKYKLMRIGVKCEAFSDPHIQSMSAVLLNNKSVAIGISFSGSTKDTTDALTLAKKSGAFTIAITNYVKSPITKVADAILLTSSNETPIRSGALTSKIAQLHVLDILYTAITLKEKEKAYEYLNKTAEAVLPKLY